MLLVADASWFRKGESRLVYGVCSFLGFFTGRNTTRYRCHGLLPILEQRAQNVGVVFALRYFQVSQIQPQGGHSAVIAGPDRLELLRCLRCLDQLPQGATELDRITMRAEGLA